MDYIKNQKRQKRRTKKVKAAAVTLAFALTAGAVCVPSFAQPEAAQTEETEESSQAEVSTPAEEPSAPSQEKQEESSDTPAAEPSKAEEQPKTEPSSPNVSSGTSNTSSKTEAKTDEKTVNQTENQTAAKETAKTETQTKAADQLVRIAYNVDPVVLADITGKPAYESEAYAFPLPTVTAVTDPFGTVDALHSVAHDGVDYQADEGTPVYALGNGTVTLVHVWEGYVNSGGLDSYGNMVEITLDDGHIVRYGHLSQINVSQGERVAKDRQIGLTGNTGHSTGPHLHFEVMDSNGVDIDPIPNLFHPQSVKLTIEGASASFGVKEGAQEPYTVSSDDKGTIVRTAGGTSEGDSRTHQTTVTLYQGDSVTIVPLSAEEKDTYAYLYINGVKQTSLPAEGKDDSGSWKYWEIPVTADLTDIRIEVRKKPNTRFLKLNKFGDIYRSWTVNIPTAEKAVTAGSTADLSPASFESLYTAFPGTLTPVYDKDGNPQYQVPELSSDFGKAMQAYVLEHGYGSKDRMDMTLVPGEAYSEETGNQDPIVLNDKDQMWRVTQEALSYLSLWEKSGVTDIGDEAACAYEAMARQGTLIISSGDQEKELQMAKLLVRQAAADAEGKGLYPQVQQEEESGK